MTDIVEGWWEDLQPKITAKGMTERQIGEMRILFYLGVMHMHDAVMAVASDSGPRSIRRGREQLEAIASELKSFGLEHFTGGNA